MPVKSAIGKNIKVSYPATGTLKSSLGKSAVAATSLQRSKKSNQDGSSKIEKEEQAEAAEIVALADFNRVFDASNSLTEYGKYYDSLEVVHSVSTDDVAYIINTAIQNDSSGQWKALKDNVDSSIADADDLKEDLANVDSKIEQACKSLNFLRTGDSDLQEEAEKFLAGKLKIYELPASERTLNIDNVLQETAVGGPASKRYSSSGGSIKALKSLIREAVSSHIISSPSDDVFFGVGQSKATKDLNPKDPKGLVWDYIDKMNSSSSTEFKLMRSATMLSHIFALSSGIRRVSQDSMSARIAFNSSRISTIFDGTKEESAVPYRKNRNSPNYGSDLISLSLMQFDVSDGSTVVPVELEDDVGGRYKSGINSLIRDPINRGEYSFSDFSNFSRRFEEGRQDIENYSELMLGYLDPENEITPEGVLRIITKNFIDALEASKSDEKSKYQLAYTSIAGSSSGAISKFMRQRLLQIAGRIKYYQLKRGESSTGAGDDASKRKTLITNKTSSDSETLKSNAKANTIQTEDKSDAATERIITRTAAASPPSDILAISMVGTLSSIATEGGPTKQKLRQLIGEVTEIINSNKSLLNLYTQLSERDERYKPYVDYFRGRVSALTDYRKDLNDQLRVTPGYTRVSAIRSHFEDSMKMTSGTFWSYMIKAYDDIIEAAQKRLPSGTKITDELGKTLHGSFDEFGILSLIVESFVHLASPLKLSIQKSGTGSVSFDEAFENAVNVAEAVEALQSAIENAIPRITVIGYSASKLSDYRDELTFLTSDKTPSDLSEITFDSAQKVKLALEYSRQPMIRYQNAMAYLAAFSNVMERSKSDLVAAFADILESPTRRAALDNLQGRKMMSTLTNQQMVYRRALMDKYRASADHGYLPARFVYSENESKALRYLLSSSTFCSNLSENLRIIAAAVPAGTIDSTREYNDPELGQQNYTGMLEFIVHHRDHELDDLIFKEKIFLFDPQLYVMPDSFVNYSNTRRITSSDAALQIAKRLTFKLYSRDDAKTLSYSDLSQQERYQNLTTSQIDEIVKNSTVSYLLETYLFKTTGMIFDESTTLNLDDSISGAAESALISVASQNLPNLVLPAGTQIDAVIGDDGEVDYFSEISGLTTGDRELIAALGSSYIMRSETPVDRLITNCRFDRVFIVPLDPDSFEIDRSETIFRNRDAGKQMLLSLQKQGLLRVEKSSYRVAPRDPINGGFSIGDISCQFVPHTASKTEGSLIKLAKDTLRTRSEKASSSKSKASKNYGSSSGDMSLKTSRGVKI